MRNFDGSSSSSIAPVGPPRSPWHSPVPYLFGGLAAMLGLIAFALLILACSYWKLSGNFEENQEGDIEEGVNNNNTNGNGDENGKMVEPPILEEKFLVIMAGQLKPTYIATPSLSSRASSFGSSNGCTTSSESSTEKSEAEEEEEEGNDILGSTLENEERTVGERVKEEEENDVSSLTPENEERWIRETEKKEEEKNISSSTSKNEERTIGEREKEEEGNDVSSSNSPLTRNDFMINVVQIQIN